MPILLIWLFFRLLTSVSIALISSWQPMTDAEKAIPIIPPAMPISAWLERVLITPWSHWDVEWYLQIVENGYQATDGTAQFHPLYPGLASILARIDIHPLLSLLLVSSLAGVLFLYLYHRIAQATLPASDLRMSMLLVLLAPAGFVLFAPYSEALFLLAAAACLWLAGQKRWWLAGLAGSLATITRQQGIVLVLPLAWGIWEAAGGAWRVLRNWWKKWLAIGLIPGAYLLWLIYRAIGLNDLALQTTSLHELIYSLLISPSAVEVVPAQTFTWPWRALWLALGQFTAAPDADLAFNFLLAAIFLIMLGISWKRMPAAYRWYVLAITLVSFSYYTGPIHPYMGLPRHLLLAFPVFIYATPALNKPILRPVLLTLLGVVYLLSIFLFYRQAWVP